MEADESQLSLGRPAMISGPLSEPHCFQPLRRLPHNPFSPQCPSQLQCQLTWLATVCHHEAKQSKEQKIRRKGSTNS